MLLGFGLVQSAVCSEMPLGFDLMQPAACRGRL